NTLVRTITLPGGGAGTFRGSNAVIWNGKDNASNAIASGTYSVNVTPAAFGYSDWTQISDDFSEGSYVYEPRGIAVNRKPGSPYYGRIFVGNALAGPGAGSISGDTIGIQKFNADVSAATEGVFATGGWPWSGGDLSPAKIEVSADDYAYITDRS